jgi:hypothetical protein
VIETTVAPRRPMMFAVCNADHVSPVLEMIRTGRPSQRRGGGIADEMRRGSFDQATENALRPGRSADPVDEIMCRSARRPLNLRQLDRKSTSDLSEYVRAACLPTLLIHLLIACVSCWGSWSPAADGFSVWLNWVWSLVWRLLRRRFGFGLAATPLASRALGLASLAFDLGLLGSPPPWLSRLRGALLPLSSSSSSSPLPFGLGPHDLLGQDAP